MEKLLEKLNEIDFEDLSVDEFMDNRDSKQIQYSDEWLDKLIEKYNNAIIPSGEL